jgi:uncharacterized Zn finger protein
VNPCGHFQTHSGVTGLDSEGTCLTCGAEWSLEDVRRAVKRANSSVTITCTLCGDGGKYSAEDVHVLTNHLGAVLVHDCRTCGNTVHSPIVPEAVKLLESAAVMFTTDLNPITPREVKAYEITLYAVDDLARLAGMAS